MPYCRFTNNLMTPIEEWYDIIIWGDGCYRYSNKDYSCCYDSHEITKDSATEFQFVLIHNSWKAIRTYKITGNILEIKDEGYDDNILSYNSLSTWTKSSRNINNLTMCDD